MTHVAKRIAELPLGGLLLTWSTFACIRDGKAKRALERGALVAVNVAGDGVRIVELAARGESRQHPESSKIVRPAAEGISAGPADPTT